MTTNPDIRFRNLNLGPLPGGGPWMILDSCPADRHNTLYAALKGGHKGGGFERCICPRALWRKQDDLDARRAEHAAWYRTHRKPAREAARAALTGEQLKPAAQEYLATVTRVREVRVPDFTHAACATEEGRAVVDAVVERADALNLSLAKALCDWPCPIKDACRKWVLEAEIRPGSWVGVFGGLTPKERKALAVRQKDEVAA